MSFTRNTLSTTSIGQGSSSPKHFSYSTSDTKAEVKAVGYFDELLLILKNGDFIYCSCSDGVIKLDIEVNNNTVYSNGLQSSASEIDNIILKKQGVSPSNIINKGLKVASSVSLDGWTPQIGDETDYSVLDEVFFGGDKCINYQGAVAGGTGITSSISVSSNFSMLNFNSISFYIWAVDIDWIDRLTIKLETDNPLNFYSFDVFDVLDFDNSRISILKAQWNNINIIKSDFIPNGSVSDTSTITKVTIEHQGHKHKANQLKFGDIFINQLSRPAITFSWDDGNLTDYTVAYKVLKEFGLTGSSFLISTLVDTDDRLSLAQIREMMDNGWTFGCHGIDNEAWTTVTLPEAETSIRESLKFLIDNNIITDGLNVTAYPRGKFNEDVIAILNKYNITCARGTELRLNHSPVNSQMKLKLGLELRPTLAENIAIFEEKMSKGGLVNIFYHDFIEDNPSYCDEETFRQFVSYVNTNYRRYITNLPQWHKDYENGTII